MRVSADTVRKTKKNLIAVPVPELSGHMGLRHDPVCLSKVCYGLIDAPTEWLSLQRDLCATNSSESSATKWMTRW